MKRTVSEELVLDCWTFDYICLKCGRTNSPKIRDCSIWLPTGNLLHECTCGEKTQFSVRHEPKSLDEEGDSK